MSPQPSSQSQGEIRLLEGAFYIEDPHRHYQWLRDEAPVYWDPHGGLWGISRHEDVMKVSKSPAL